MSFGERLRELRKENKLTLRQLAKQAEVDFGYLSKIENDKEGFRPAEKLIRTLAEILHADAEELILLAEKIPADVEQQLTRNPKAKMFLRTAATLDDDEWDAILKILEKRKKKQ